MKFRCLSFLMRNDLCASAAILCLLLGFAHAANAQRLSTNVIPSHYSLDFMPDLKAATFSGSEVIDVSIKEPTNAITLNANELKFESVGIIFHERRSGEGIGEPRSRKGTSHIHVREYHSGRRRDAAHPVHGNPQRQVARLLSYRKPSAAAMPSRSSSPRTPAAPFPASTSRPSRPRSR